MTQKNTGTDSRELAGIAGPRLYRPTELLIESVGRRPRLKLSGLPSTGIIVGVVLLAGLLVIPAVADAQVKGEPDNPDKWNTIETEKFIFHYEDGYESEAQEMSQVTQQAYEELLQEMPDNAEEFDFSPKVHVYMHGESWSRGGGAVWYDTSPIAINIGSPSANERVSRDTFEQVMAHEIANVILWDSAGQYDQYNYYQRNPSWLGEGLSEYYVYRTSSVEDQYPPSGVEQINETIKDNSGTFATVAGSPYSGGHLIMEYLIDEYGEAAVWSVLQSDAQEWPAAVQDGFGVDEQTMQQGWYPWAEDNVGGDYAQFYSEEQRQNELVEAREQIDSLKQQVAEKNQTIRDLESQLDDKDRRISELESQLDDKDNRISELETQLENTDVTIDVSVEPEDQATLQVGGAMTVDVNAQGGSPSDVTLNFAGQEYAASGGEATIPLDSAGTQQLDINYQDTTETITLDVADQEEDTATDGDSSADGGADDGSSSSDSDGSTTDDDGSADDDGAGFGIVAALVALSGIGLLFRQLTSESEQ